MDRKARRAKTDRLEVERLLRLVLRYEGGERQALRVVRVPTEAEEDQRRLPRERERLESGVGRVLRAIASSPSAAATLLRNKLRWWQVGG